MSEFLVNVDDDKVLALRPGADNLKRTYLQTSPCASRQVLLALKVVNQVRGHHQEVQTEFQEGLEGLNVVVDIDTKGGQVAEIGGRERADEIMWEYRMICNLP